MVTVGDFSFKFTDFQFNFFFFCGIGQRVSVGSNSIIILSILRASLLNKVIGE
jgi:hypothetical protein